MKEIKVYIASPYTNGWMPTNVKRQIEAGNQLMDWGYFPYIPLLAHFLEIYLNRPEEDWLNLDLVFLKTCDAVLRLKPTDKDGNEINSPGADLEEETARENLIPVFYNLEHLNVHFKSDPRFNYKQKNLFNDTPQN